MRRHYAAYGLAIEADVALPCLPPSPPAPPDVLLHLDPAAWPAAAEALRASPAVEAGNLALHRGADLLLARYRDGAAFAVTRDGRHVFGRWDPHFTLADATTYLLGSVFSVVLRQRGIVALHASAVAVDGRAVLLVGPSGSGKSTLTLALADRGATVVADDLAALDEADGPRVLAGFPQLRLWPDAVAALRGSADALPRLAPPWDKRYHGLDTVVLADAAVPVGAVVVLLARGSEPPVASRIAPSRALVHLLANVRAAELAEPADRGREFAVLGRLADAVPAWELRPRADLTRVGELADLVRDRCRGLAPATR